MIERSSATSFAGAARERFSGGWLRAALRHNAPSLDELRRPSTLWRGARMHLGLRHTGYTMTSSKHGRTLYALARQVQTYGVPGSLVDCGVWNGGSCALLAAGAPGRPLFAFDSFEGLPEPGPHDGADSEGWSGTYRGDPMAVERAVAKVNQQRMLTLVPGWFEDTLAAQLDAIGQIAVLHVDADWYESVKMVLDTLAARVVAGGYIVVDDYVSWAGASRATDEYRTAHDITAQLVERHYWRVPTG